MVKRKTRTQPCPFHEQKTIEVSSVGSTSLDLPFFVDPGSFLNDLN